ncbi:recombinase family protein [Luteimonas terrae]|uniref:DNA invertase Pin-like site-specific DNA recombinase n=1 Tax=Luteimonas terrae TaxID=1530191 RepID=A0ABU1XYT2_9GAMM|nr:recombinase family protein [Luteimonas terrae]MDR7193370.1 DNA invertase Pin-like site-specific DNA recombinase [Luteimonas terrae]
MRALGYIRVSTAEQAATGHSLQQQRERIAAWCVAKDMTLVDLVIDEGVSAGKPLAKRKGGAVLLERMRSNEADVVVSVSLDRLFRDTQDGLNTLIGLDGQPGMRMQSVTEMLDSTTAMGRFILTVWLGRAQLEREQTCERNLAVSRGLRAAGKPNGNTPFGCVVQDGRLYRCPRHWPMRERIAAMAGQGDSLQSIVDALHANHIAAPMGGPKWTRKAVSRVVSSHDGLKHLPPLPDVPEPPVSEAADA